MTPLSILLIPYNNIQKLYLSYIVLQNELIIINSEGSSHWSEIQFSQLLPISN